VRPNEPAVALLDRMEKRKVPAVIVTTKDGILVGVEGAPSVDQLVSILKERGLRSFCN
jgi:hypothetical protein